MQGKTKEELMGLINEARLVYQTEPVAAALMLSQGVSSIEKPTPICHPRWQGMPPTYGESKVLTAFRTLQMMVEDAHSGIPPTPAEWEIHLAVAESIPSMMESSNFLT